MKDRHIVARVAEMPPGSRQVVSVGGHEIGIFNLDGWTASSSEGHYMSMP